MKRRYRYVVILVLLIYCFVFTGLFVETRANLSLGIQEQSFSRPEILNSLSYDLSLPILDGWNEKIRLYQTSLEDRKLDIYYNYGAYEGGRSSFYDSSSPYYNSHYGLYVIEGSYGDKGLDQFEKLIRKDQLDLVMASLGIKEEDKSLFYTIEKAEDSFIEARIRTNGPLHKKKENLLGYLQYGSPPRKYEGEDFPLVDMVGRIKHSYDESLDLTYIFFVISKDYDLLDTSFKTLVDKTEISLLKD